MPLCCVTSAKPAFLERKSGIWMVRDYSFIGTDELRSPALFKIAGCEFGLTCNLSEGDDDEKVLSVFMWCEGSPGLTVRNHVKIIDKAGHELSSGFCHSWYCKGKKFGHDREDLETCDQVGLDDFETHEDCLQKTEDDTLMLELTIAASPVDRATADKVKSQQAAVERCGNSGPLQLTSDIRDLLLAKKHTDVLLQATDAEGSDAGTLHAHRLILASRSPVFESMFFGGGAHMGKSSADTAVQMIDVSSDVAEAFLHAVYTDEIADEVWSDPDALCHLLRGFHAYQMKELTGRCEKRVLLQLTEQNVAERLMMSDWLDLPTLRSAALDFIVSSSRCLANVQSTEGYQRLIDKRPRLLAEIVSRGTPPTKRESTPDELPEDLETLTVVRLKGLLSDRGLPTAGAKRDLIQRLRASSQ